MGQHWWHANLLAQFCRTILAVYVSDMDQGSGALGYSFTKKVLSRYFAVCKVCMFPSKISGLCCVRLVDTRRAAAVVMATCRVQVL